MNNKPITSVEMSQDLTTKSLKISKQVILEKYTKERSTLVAQRTRALGDLFRLIKEDWEGYDEFFKLIKTTVVACAKTQVREIPNQTRLCSLLNSVLQFEIKSNADLWIFPEVDWHVPCISELLDARSIHHRIVSDKFNKVEGFDEDKPIYSVSYSYSSTIVNSLDYDDDYNSRFSVDESLPAYTIEVILPHNVSLTVSKILEYLSLCAKVDDQLTAITLKEQDIDTHLEKLEAQLLVKELQDTGNTDALATIESIIRSATGDNTLLLMESK